MSDEFADELALWDAWGKQFEDLANHHPLRVLFWQTTLACDSCCEYCSSPNEWWLPGSELSTEEICIVLENIANDFDLPNLAQLSFTGGEPLLRRDLPIVANRARELGFAKLAVQTNGRIATRHQDLVEELINAGITVWGVNIDGPQDVHDSMRQRGTWFHDAFSFARNICGDHRLITTITTLVSARNVHVLPQTYNLVHELNPDLWRIALFDPIGRGTEVAGRYYLSNQDYRKLFEFVAGVRARHQDDAFEVEVACGGWLGKQWEGIVRPFIFHCVSGLDTMTILYDGGITGCPVVSRKLIQGNVREDNLKDVWENRFEFFRDPKGRAPSRCVNCSDWTYCHGGCLHNYERLEPGWSFPICLRDSGG